MASNLPHQSIEQNARQDPLDDGYLSRANPSEQFDAARVFTFEIAKCWDFPDSGSRSAIVEMLGESRLVESETVCITSKMRRYRL